MLSFEPPQAFNSDARLDARPTYNIGLHQLFGSTRRDCRAVEG
jgi:hypothetical protein